MNEIIKKNGISFGIGMGLFSIVTTTLIYAIDMGMFASIWLGLGLMAIYLIVDIALLSKTKKQLGGVMSFKEGFTVFFIAAVIATALSTVYNIVLFNFVDPGAKETIKEISIKSAVSMMEKFGAPASQINETVAKMQEQDTFSIASQATNFFIALCISCVLGLILALIFKSKPASSE